MANYRYMLSAEDIAKELNCSKSHAYKIVKELNKELAGQGYITFRQGAGAVDSRTVKGIRTVLIPRQRIQI